MTMINEYIWSVTPHIPAHLHEERNSNGLEIQVTQDQIVARAAEDNVPGQEERAKKVVESIVRSFGLDAETRFEARLYRVNQVNTETGHESAEIRVSGVATLRLVGTAPTLLISADGEVLKDSKADHLKELHQRAESIGSSPALTEMTDFMLEYFADPDRDLGIIYSLLERTERTLKTDGLQLNDINITTDRFKLAKRIANSHRHRGKGRDPEPTGGDIVRCEEVAKRIIYEYQQVLEKRIGSKLD